MNKQKIRTRDAFTFLVLAVIAGIALAPIWAVVILGILAPLWIIWIIVMVILGAVKQAFQSSRN